MSLIHWNKSIFLAGLLTAALSAQTNPICGANDTVTPTCNTFDNSGTGMLTGTYFIREIQLSGVSTSGTSLSVAYSLSGTMTFTPTTDTTGTDSGTYTFSGQELVYEAEADPTISGPTAYSNTTGFYRVSANGMLWLSDPIATLNIVTGVVGAAGPNAFIASSPNNDSTGANISLIVGIPVGGTTLSGNYFGSYFDFHVANVSSIREASFPFTANGGSLGNLTVTGAGTDLGDSIMTQMLPSVSYSFSSNVGTLNFGGQASTNFISGTQTFYVSTDGSIIVGGTPGDFDLLVGVQALGGTPSNASLKGVYFLGGIQDDATQPGYTIFDAFYGSTSATGTGTSITHRTMASSILVNPAFRDYTTAASGYTISSDVFAPGDGYQYFLGTNGTFLGTGQGGFYSVILGMQPPAAIQKPTGTVWLNPIGIVNSANYAGVTNPIAPNELVQLYGTGFASGAMSAPLNTTLPTSLNNVQVYVNGGYSNGATTPSPLLYVSPTVINMVAPSDWYPGSGWGYLTFQVCLGARASCDAGTGTYSNPVRVLAQNSAPSVFALNMQGTGQADVLHADTGLVAGSANPAHPGDMVSILATGLGITLNQPPDGSVGINSPFQYAWQVWMGGVQCDPTLATNYAGLAPGYTAGVYELNVTVPSGTGFGPVPLEVWTTEGQTIQTTIFVEPSQVVGVVKR
ncbi:MAG: hypothetical protein ABSB67_11640 [Bryobacteraceae bacterium]